MRPSQILKKLLLDPNTLVVPDAFDGLSARMIQESGFQAVQCSGHSIARSKCLPNERDLSLNSNLAATHEIVQAVTLPVMADGEDGYGDDSTFEETLERFHEIGIAGINIEDQNLRYPQSNESILPESVAVSKIRRAVALKARMEDPEWIINARTDALRSDPDRTKALSIAINRANHFLEAGADLVFVAYVATLEEVRTLAKEIRGPLSIAAGLGYNAHLFSVQDCIDLGIARVSLPTLLIDATQSAIQTALTSIPKS